MNRKLHIYESDGIVVEYDLKRCIHSAECVRGLPAVFDPGRVPWIDPSRAGTEEIADVVRRCPTGALHYRRTDGGPEESPPEENIAAVGPGGPLYLRGRIRIEFADGEVMRETRVALCRCGASRDKPFCDGSHADVDFSDPGLVRGGRLVPAEELAGRAEDAARRAGTGEAETGEVTITCRPNGPLLVSGPLRIAAADGETVEGVKGALCRCGHSGTKPFCDGSHKHVDFLTA